MKVHHIDFYPDEWLAGTATLSVADRGLYITAVAMIYSHGGPVKIADLKLVSPMHGRAFKNSLARLIEAGKLRINGAEISCKRCENELEKARNRIAKATQNGRKGGRPINKNNEIEKPDGFPAGKLTTNYQLPDISLDADASRESARPPPEPPTLVLVAGDERGSEHARRQAAARKSRIAADWQPDQRDCDYAAARGHGGRWIGEQAEAFADWHRAHGGTAADWHAAWRTWVRRAEEFEQRRGGLGRPAGPGRNGLAAVVGEIAAGWRDG